MPEPASIRVEEFVNAFNYHDPAPQGNARLAFAWERAHYPFAHNRDVLRFATINGLPGVIVDGPEGAVQTAAFEIEGDVIRALYVVRNPDKLRHLAAAPLPHESGRE